MYLHRRCRPDEIDLDYDKVAFGYCSACNLLGSIYHVKGAEDYFVTRKQGITFSVRDGAVEGTIMVKRPIAEVTAETVKELETKEEVEETEDSGTVLEETFQDIERAQEEVEEVAESIPSEEQIDEGVEKIAKSLGIPEEFIEEKKADEKAQKEAVIEADAQIAELEAKLAELKKKAK